MHKMIGTVFDIVTAKADILQMFCNIVFRLREWRPPPLGIFGSSVFLSKLPKRRRCKILKVLEVS